MRFISYAQNFEDVILWRVLKDIEYGTYIDIGASDPTLDSVTRAFYDRGWRGINVEPIDLIYHKLNLERPDDINLKVAIGSEVGNRKFYLIDNGNGLSTLMSNIAENHIQSGWNIKEIFVPVITLKELFSTFVQGTVNFLKIDVEGAEEEVLLGADFINNRPWIIVIESTLPGTKIEVFENWEYILNDANYTFVYFDGLNRYYLANEIKDNFLDEFNSPPNIFDNFITVRENNILLELEKNQILLKKSEENLQNIIVTHNMQISKVKNCFENVCRRENLLLQKLHEYKDLLLDIEEEFNKIKNMLQYLGNENQKLYNECNQYKIKLERIHNSKSYKFIQIIRKIKAFLKFNKF